LRERLLLCRTERLMGALAIRSPCSFSSLRMRVSDFLLVICHSAALDSCRYSYPGMDCHKDKPRCCLTKPPQPMPFLSRGYVYLQCLKMSPERHILQSDTVLLSWYKCLPMAPRSLCSLVLVSVFFLIPAHFCQSRTPIAYSSISRNFVYLLTTFFTSFARSPIL
jgi:hypothetical protein